MSETRINRIRELLTQQFAPAELEIIDESHLHAGHAGARDGRGHFRLRIVADHFRAMPPLKRHRAIYAALDDMMKSDIHALSIEAEATQQDTGS